MNTGKNKLVLVLIASTALMAALVLWLFLSPKNLNIRYFPSVSSTTFTDEEAKTLNQLHQECFEDTRRIKLTKYLRERATQLAGQDPAVVEKRVAELVLSERLKSKDAYKSGKELYVAYDGGQVVGLFNCYDDHTYTQNGVMMYNICLDKDLRGQGLGKKMVQYGIEHCKKPGRPLALVVYKDHDSSIKLYENLGFKIMNPPVMPAEGFDFFDKHYMEYFY